MEFDINGRPVLPQWVAQELNKRDYERESKRKIIELYNSIAKIICTKYKIVVPELKISNMYCNSYLPALNVIRILPSMANDMEKCRQVIIHEFCHAIQEQLFHKHRKGYGHDLKFYRLCVEFGLPFEHDSNDNVLKRQAYNENLSK